MNELSFEDLAEQVAEEMRAEKAKEWRKNPKWLAIKGISREDLLSGSSYIEKLTYPPWDKRNDSKGGTPVNQADSVGYGKHAKKSFEWVKENDYGYFLWMCENVDKFRVRAKQLDLI